MGVRGRNKYDVDANLISDDIFVRFVGQILEGLGPPERGFILRGVAKTKAGAKYAPSLINSLQQERQSESLGEVVKTQPGARYAPSL